jgi:hypothetical protein
MKNLGHPDHEFDGRPVIGICNTWAETNPCNGHLHDLARYVKNGIREAGGLPLEFSAMSLGETGVEPEWFYKGDGSWIVPPGAGRELADFALDGGEEPEIAGDIFEISAEGFGRPLLNTLVRAASNFRPVKPLYGGDVSPQRKQSGKGSVAGNGANSAIQHSNEEDQNVEKNSPEHGRRGHRTKCRYRLGGHLGQADRSVQQLCWQLLAPGDAKELGKGDKRSRGRWHSCGGACLYDC